MTDLSLRSDLAIHQGGEIAWAMRKDNPLLRDLVNRFAATHKIGTTFGNILKKRYFGTNALARHATAEEDIRRLDQLLVLFEQYGAEYSFDALMIAAQGFQVCTVACNTTTPCPDDKSGTPGTCESNICVPSAPNMCHL